MAKIGSIKEAQNVVEAVKKVDLTYLRTIVPETLLELDQTLNYRFVIDPTFLQMLREIKKGLGDFKTTHIDELDKQLNNDKDRNGHTGTLSNLPLGLNDQITLYEKRMDDLMNNGVSGINALEAKKNLLDPSDKANKDPIKVLGNDITTKRNEFNSFEGKIKEAENKIKEIEARKKELEDFLIIYKDNIGASDAEGTRGRLGKLIDIAEKFDATNLLKRQLNKLGDPVIKDSQELKDTFFKGGTVPPHPDGSGPYPVSYTICDNQDGNPLIVENGGVKVTIDGGQTVTLTGVKIVNNKLEVEKIQIEPTAGVTFPVNFRLNIRARIQDDDTGISLDHFKKLDFTINASNFDKTAREKEIELYNNAGTGKKIEASMKASHDNNLEKIEKEMFFKAVAQGDGPKLEKLSESQKDDLYESVRAMYRLPNGTPDNGTFPWVTGLKDMSDFKTGPDSFTKWMSADEHESNKPEFTRDAVAYRDYIHNNLEDQIKKYFENRFTKVFAKNKEANTFLKAQVTNYLTDVENQKKDSDDVHKDINESMKDKKYEMKNTRRFGFFGRKDVNYLRFFTGSDSRVSVSNQTVNIVRKKSTEPIKYNMDLEVTGKQGIMATIKIEKLKEMKVKAGDPIALIRSILRNPDIPEGKTRAHIAYNIVKGMISMAVKKDISLTYRDSSGHNMVIKLDGKNIVLEDQDDLTNYGGTNKRNTKTIFDYSKFENTNVFDAQNDNRSLRTGIESLMGHFNFAMNNVHEHYRHATERRRLGLRNSNATSDFPTSFWLNPIKKLANIRRNMKFDFSTTATANGKTVNIEFKKNTFTLQMEGLKKPISSRDLGSLLQHRVGGIRIFDGIERDICKSAYQNMIEKLRTNTKIARSNFGVRDPMTGRLYILDEDGQFGYVRAEDQEDHIKKRNVGNIIKKSAITGGLLAGGFFTGGVSALATPISRGGAATAGLRGAGAVSGAGLGTYLGTHRGREFGVIDHPPAGRIMCDESETKELLKNPFLMGRLMKAMNDKL